MSISTNGGTTYTNRTSGLGSLSVRSVYASGSNVYAATASILGVGGGVSVSTDGGATFTNSTTANGLGSNLVVDVYASGGTIYAATQAISGVGGGLGISTDGGASFTNYTTADGLGSNFLNSVYVAGSTIYVATGVGLGTSGGGVSISASDPLAADWNTTSGTWNTTARNWTANNGTTVFRDGDTVSFSGTGGGTVTLSGTAAPAAIVVSAASGTYTLASSAGNLIAGTAGLAKSGGGTLVLSGSNSFTGATSVTGGTLLVNGVLSSGTTTVSTAGLVGGSGTVGGLLEVLAGGTLAPGDGRGILTAGRLDLQSGGTTRLDIVGNGTTAGTAGVDFDQVLVTMAAPAFGGLLDLAFGNTGAFADGTIFDLFDFPGSPARSFDSITSSGSGIYAGLTFLAGGGMWTASAAGQTISFNEATGILSFNSAVPIPEIDPAGMGSVLALVIGGFGLLERRRLKAA